MRVEMRVMEIATMVFRRGGREEKAMPFHTKFRPLKLICLPLFIELASE